MPPHPTANVRAKGSRIGAGWRVLRRHLRYARHDPRKLVWIVRRAWQIMQRGELPGVLQRHRVVEDFYGGYAHWVAERARTDEERSAIVAQAAASWPFEPTFSILMPVYEPQSAYLHEAVQAVRAQRYKRWQLCLVDDGSKNRTHVEDLRRWSREEPRIVVTERADNGGIAVASNDALASARGEFCLFLDQDDALAPEALLWFAQRIVERPQALLVYADEDYIDASGRRTRPVLKPDWDPEWLLSTNYVMHPVAVRTAFLRRIGGLRQGFDGVQDWDLLLRIGDVARADAIEHVPEILYHWREHAGSTAAGINEKAGIAAAQKRSLADTLARRKQDAAPELTPGGWRVRYALPSPPPLASLVIPTRDRPLLLAMCLKGLRERTDYVRWEAVVIDNGTVDAQALALLRELARDSRFKVIRDDRPFNYAALCNAGAAAASGEVLVLLNNDVEPISRDWLAELVAHARRPEIGMVGAALYYPDDTIQHVGVVLGLNGVADRPYVGYPRGFRGVDSRLGSVHTVTAMITACAAVRRQTYAQLGGMDESLPVACNDLDLCLRIEALGLRNILTPFAELYHHESASRGYHYDNAESLQETADEARFRQKWGPRLEHDPMYNRNLTRRGLAYSLADPA